MEIPGYESHFPDWKLMLEKRKKYNKTIDQYEVFKNCLRPINSDDLQTSFESKKEDICEEINENDEKNDEIIFCKKFLDYFGENGM